MQKSPLWSLMHDGITKFGTEYHIVYCLSMMKGRVTDIDTGNFFVSYDANFLVNSTILCSNQFKFN